MMHKKSKFLNFCFSCLPGAGQMYQGFMKRGVSIMALFFGMLALISYFGIDELIFCLPVIWFYGFFDGIHRNSLPDNEYMQLKDGYLFVDDDFGQLDLKKYRIPAAVLLIFIGGYSLIRTFVYGLIINQFEGFYWDSPIVNIIDNVLPKTVLSIVIIWLGVYLISGKKKEIEEDFKEKTFYQERNNMEGDVPVSTLIQGEEESEDDKDGGEEV